MIRTGAGVLGLSLALALSGCGGTRERPRHEAPATEVTPAPEGMAMPAGEKLVFSDDFREAGAPKWEPIVGDWDLTQDDVAIAGYGSTAKGYGLTYAGNPNWSNYSVNARVTILDDRQGPVGLVGRGETDHFYFELVLGRDEKGAKTWSIRERLLHHWNILATGPFDYRFNEPLVMRLTFHGRIITGSISNNNGRSFGTLGEASVDPTRWQLGRFGLVTYGGAASFDDVFVTGPETIALIDNAHGWGAVSLIRDNTTTFTNGKPSGGWYVTPIHANLRASDGKVLITGFSRKGASACSGTTQRQNGMTWVLDPGVVDAAADGSTMLVTPINEQNRDTVHDVLYCAGHSTLADGRVFFTAGTRYPMTLPNSSPERGLRYSRIFNPATGSFTRIEANMGGGQSADYPDPGNKGDGGTVRGEKWYPTTTLMPDGRVLIFGGFHFSAGGTGDKPNNSFEMFDPTVWDANHNANPYTVLLQHGTTAPQNDLPPTRGYSNVFVLPKPVPAGSGNGFARSIAIAGGVGRVVLFSHEDGPPNTVAGRLFARTNSLTTSPNGSPNNERAEGSSGVLLTDGRILFTNGGHTGAGAAKSYVYDPYADAWSSFDTTISRMYGDGVQLPDGKVMIINGYNGNPGGNGQSDPEDGNTTDIANPIGDVRQPVLTDPYVTPMTASPQTAWPEVTHRGYHAIALLLKDGRILVGGGKDGTHATGCEKNEVRIYTPPYLQGNPTRPAISNITEGQTVTVGAQAFTINYTGTLSSVRGVALLKPGSLTHAFDMGQRYIPLTIVSGGGASGSVSVLPPTNVNIAQPGDYVLFVIGSNGAPSVGKWVRLAAPPACVFQMDGAATTYLEAETPSRKDGPFASIGDETASGQAYIEVADGSGNHSTVPDEGKVMWYDLNITNGGTFFLWGRGQGVDTASDSFWVSVDSNPDIQLNTLPAAGFGWVQSTSTLALPTGKHTLKIKVREDLARLDKIALTKASGFVPSGLGGGALLCNGGMQPPPPPNAPTSLVANDGVGQASLTWADGGGATSYKIERKPQGAMDSSFAQVGTSASPSFVDSPVPAGSYTYRVRANNAGGDSPYSNNDDATVTAPMGPSAPTNLSATIAGGNVTLTWVDTSSSETGFRVEKKIGAGSYTTLASKGVNVQTHADNGVTTAGSYTYRVIATGTPDSSPSNEFTVVVAIPAADAYVRGSTNGDNTYGVLDPNVLLAKTWVTNPENARQIYVRFPLAGISPTVASVKLRLFGNASGTAKATSVYGVANTTWSETTITFNNAPAMDASAQATTTVGTTAAWFEWDLTSYVQAAKTAGATDVSFGIKSDPISNDTQTSFNSKEGANDPVLMIGSK
jgi:hypothetical protein